MLVICVSLEKCLFSFSDHLKKSDFLFALSCMSPWCILGVVYVIVQSLSCIWLCDSTDCSPPGFSVHEIFQARILEWVAIPFSRGSSWTRDWTQVSCIIADFLLSEPPGKPANYCNNFKKAKQNTIMCITDQSSSTH